VPGSASINRHVGQEPYGSKRGQARKLLPWLQFYRKCEQEARGLHWCARIGKRLPIVARYRHQAWVPGYLCSLQHRRSSAAFHRRNDGVDHPASTYLSITSERYKRGFQPSRYGNIQRYPAISRIRNLHAAENPNNLCGCNDIRFSQA